jgi:hypothetical protein
LPGEIKYCINVIEMQRHNGVNLIKSVKGCEHLEDLVVGGRIILKENAKAWSGLILLRIRTSGRLL